MAKIVQPPPKFIPPEWHHSNFVKYSNAEGQRLKSERLVDESSRLIDEVDKTTQRTQRDVNNKLEQRLDDIHYWKSELELKLTEITTEIETLLHFKSRIEKALAACEQPLAIAHQCLLYRENRIGIDLVYDKVERELLKEVEVIQGVIALLKRVHEQAVEQIRLNRSAKFYLEQDLKGKACAQDIDTFCSELRNNSTGIGFHANVTKIEPNSVTPEEWVAFSNANDDKAERERNSSIALRSSIDGILKQTTDDMKEQCNAVNLSLQLRVAELKRALDKLRKHLEKVLAEISSMEKNMMELDQAIADKRGPMMVAQTRLDERTRRPNIELCRDPVQYRTIEEVDEITTNINRLASSLAQSEIELKGLCRNQLLLEEDIQVKTNSLYIDEVQCMGIRKAISLNYF